MKTLLPFLLFFLTTNFLFAQMPESCNKCLEKLIQSSSHYKKRFGSKDIFLNKKWSGDASSDGYNLTFTIYAANEKVGTYNRIVTYQLNGATNKLSVKDSFPKYNSADVKYDKKLLLDVFKYCRKDGRFIKSI